jgi:hypothetical protein
MAESANQSNHSVEPRISKEWAIRLVILGVVLIGYGCWSLYDGFIAYPRENQLYELTHWKDGENWYSYLERSPAGVSEQAFEREVRQKIEEAGFDPTLYDEPAEVSDLEPRGYWSYIFAQYVQAAICLPLGILSFVWLIKDSRYSLRADADGFVVRNKRYRYDQVAKIDRQKWAKKGIADIEMRDGSRVRIDDWKYPGSEAVLLEIERRSGVEPVNAGPGKRTSATASSSESDDAAAKPEAPTS